jgi:hypothetical protein
LKKKKEKTEKKPKEVKQAPASAPRGDLMEGIRKGQKLKHVSEEEKKGKDLDLDDQNVLNLIAKALIQRRNVIKEEEHNDEDNLEDWL